MRMSWGRGRDAGLRPHVAELGYTFGFLIIVPGRHQLLTENRLTAVKARPREQTYVPRTSAVYSGHPLNNFPR